MGLKIKTVYERLKPEVKEKLESVKSKYPNRYNDIIYHLKKYDHVSEIPFNTIADIDAFVFDFNLPVNKVLISLIQFDE